MDSDILQPDLAQTATKTTQTPKKRRKRNKRRYKPHSFQNTCNQVNPPCRAFYSHHGARPVQIVVLQPSTAGVHIAFAKL